MDDNYYSNLMPKWTTYRLGEFQTSIQYDLFSPNKWFFVYKLTDEKWVERPDNTDINAISGINFSVLIREITYSDAKKFIKSEIEIAYLFYLVNPKLNAWIRTLRVEHPTFGNSFQEKNAVTFEKLDNSKPLPLKVCSLGPKAGKFDAESFLE